MRRVAIFGVGLIGGSFALALRRAGFDGEIVGVSSARTIAEAVALGVIDRGAVAAEAASEADLLYLAQPVLSIISTIELLGPSIQSGAIVTDAGSTKSRIVESARRRIQNAVFVGGHPMAGKERRGVSEADAALFEGRKYVLTPATRDERKSHGFEVLLDWIGRIGAVPVILDPDEHDRLVAFTSHMPQLLSTALGSVLSETPGVSQVAGPAVLELTRLAASSYDVWRDILITNEDHVREALKAVLIKLQYLHDNIGAEAIADEFSRAFDGARRVRGQESK